MCMLIFDKGKELTKMIKKFFAVTLSFILTVSALSGCKKDGDNGSSSESSSSSSVSQADSAAEQEEAVPEAKLVIDGEELDTDGLIICTVDGHDVDFDTFRYYYKNMLEQYKQENGITVDSIRESENGFENLLNDTVMQIMQDYVTYRVCDDNSLSLSDEEKQAVEDQYQSSLETAGSEEALEQSLKEAYMTPELFRTRLELASLYVKAEDELFTNEGVYATSKEDFREIAQDTEKYACVRTIYIPYWCKTELTDETAQSAYDGYSLDQKNTAKKAAYDALDDAGREESKKAAKEVAETCAQKVADGGDFDELLNEYNWDALQDSYPNGEFLSPESNYDKTYLETVFSLGEGETSALVENENFGWTIIKRLPMDMDYVESNIETLIKNYDLPMRQQVYADILDNMKVTYSDVYNKLTIDSIT